MSGKRIPASIERGNEANVAPGLSDSNPFVADPVLPGPVVIEIVRKYAPIPDGTTVEIDESGGEARAYLIGDELVVKTQRPHRVRPRTSLAKETRVLLALSEPLGGRVPHVFGYEQANTPLGPVELIVMSRMAGQAVRRAPQVTERAELFSELAEALGAIHRLDASDLMKSCALPADDHADDLRSRLRSGFAELLAEVDSCAGSRLLPISLQRVVDTALSALPAVLTEPLCLLHSNPGPTHVFVDSAGHFSGLIDFGDSYRSHPALDLIRWPDPADRSALFQKYRARWPVSDSFTAVWMVASIRADLELVIGGGSLATAAESDLLLHLQAIA
jgi:hygromycin-B 7''-O-kinase